MERRSFLEASAIVGLGAGILPGQLINMNSKKVDDVINLGIIGTGDRGSGLINIIKEFPQFKVIALCDIIPFRLESAVKKLDYQVDKYKDYEKLLSNNNVDAVIIATPLSMPTDPHDQGQGRM